MTEQQKDPMQDRSRAARSDLRRQMLQSWFSQDEQLDIEAAARERGRSIHGLVHDAVMEALYR